VFPNAVLLDTGDVETPLDILTPFMSETDRTMKKKAIAGRTSGWVWDIQQDHQPPQFPAPVSTLSTSR
jgi:hypothetical protein